LSYLDPATSDATVYLDEMMGHTEVEEMGAARTTLRSNFSNIGLCLLPHPGKTVTSSQFCEKELLSAAEAPFAQLLVHYFEKVLWRFRDDVPGTFAF
jgi:hypothetical protein